MSRNPAPTLSPYMTGGSGANTMLDSAMVAEFSAWPPTALGTDRAAFLPTYTPTGNIITMAVSTPTSFPSGYSATPSVGNGWFQASDTAGWMTEVAGCSYVHPWSGAGAAGESESLSLPSPLVARKLIVLFVPSPYNTLHGHRRSHEAIRVPYLSPPYAYTNPSCRLDTPHLHHSFMINRHSSHFTKLPSTLVHSFAVRFFWILHFYRIAYGSIDD
jgi:hypothetical protein